MNKETFSSNKNIINYSQCWEDFGVLSEAIRINRHDFVLSITSGGDNTLALLLFAPKNLVSIDFNPVQNYLLELKLAAALDLSYSEYLAFLGVNPTSQRLQYFNRLKPLISPNANSWWSNNQSLINKGVINIGRFEKYLNLFQKYILPFIHSSKTIKEFIATSSIVSQRKFYQRYWNTKLWRLYFSLVSSRFVLKYFARQKGMFKHVGLKNVAGEYFKRLNTHLNTVLILNNYFMHYVLTGRYNKFLPPYLQKKNFDFLKSKINSNFSIINSDLLSYLKSKPDNTFTKFNLSDIFEAQSDTEVDLLWKEIIRTSKKGAVVAYWDNLLQRPVPKRFSKIVRKDKVLSDRLFAKSKVFFYGNFYIYIIEK